MSRLRRIGAFTLLVIFLGATLAPTAAAARARYRRPVDITFPTRRKASYSNDYRAPRTGHVHRATDLFARHGTPVYAAKGGRVVWLPQPRHPTAGYSIWVRGQDQRIYAYYHLGRDGRSRRSAYRKGLRLGAFVRRGSRIGYVGSSGNASLSSPHLHFEMHGPKVRDPWGGNRINPYFSLRRAERRGNYSRGRGAGSDQRRRRGHAQRRRHRPAQRRRHPPGRRRVRRARAHARHRRARAAANRRQRRRVAQRRERRRVAQRRERRRRRARFVVLHKGMRGPGVKRWQRKLTRALRGRVAADGVFGPRTRRATRHFQRTRGLKPTGRVGRPTRRRMRRALR